MQFLKRIGLVLAIVAFAANVQPPIADAVCTATCSCAVYTVTNNSPVLVVVCIQPCIATAPVIYVTVPAGGVVNVLPPTGGPCIFSAQVVFPVVGPVCFCPNICPVGFPINGIAVNPCTITVF